MKKILLMFGVFAFICACSGTKTEVPIEGENVIEETVIDVVDSLSVDSLIVDSIA